MVSRVRLRLAGEAGAELTTALPREPREKGCGWDAQPGLSSTWPGAKFFKEKLVEKTCPLREAEVWLIRIR